MTHNPQAGATAESLSAENALLARAVIQMAATLQGTRDLLRMIASQDRPLVVERTPTDGHYRQRRLEDDAHDVARLEVIAITALLDREREAIEAAARVWPPKGE